MHDAGDNRRLDAEIERRVFGREVEFRYVEDDEFDPYVAHATPPEDYCVGVGPLDVTRRVPGYHVSVSAAWLVVERLRELGWRMQVTTARTSEHGECYEVFVYRGPRYPENGHFTYSESAPECICRAALAALPEP